MINIPKQLQNSEFKFVLLGEWNKWINSKTKEVKTVSIEEYRKYKENSEWRT
jgi:hypothetical protein